MAQRSNNEGAVMPKRQASAPVVGAGVSVTLNAGKTSCTAARIALAAVARGGTLIVSGILASESDAVRRAFSAASLAGHRQEDEWVCLVLKKP